MSKDNHHYPGGRMVRKCAPCRKFYQPDLFICTHCALPLTEALIFNGPTEDEKRVKEDASHT